LSSRGANCHPEELIVIPRSEATRDLVAIVEIPRFARDGNAPSRYGLPASRSFNSKYNVPNGSLDFNRKSVRVLSSENHTSA